MLKRSLIALCSVLLFAGVFANADEWDKKTTVTFGRPVELPGFTLPAGSYVFKLVNLGSNRHIVRVFDTTETKVYGTMIAIPNWRLKPTSDTTLSFAERPKTEPEALRAWFYPGDNFGQEFVYPKRRATQLAEVTHAPVLAAEVRPSETPQELAKEPVVAVTPENKEVEIAQVVEPPPAEVAQARPAPAPEAPAELPKTGSPLPLITLAGLEALLIGGLLKLLSRHAAEL
jgi:LPXTG-motif cell wall-anchored protein